MQFVLSADNEILWRADWMPMEILRAMVKAANEVQAPNAGTHGQTHHNPTTKAQ
jgi:hypothetical protein